MDHPPAPWIHSLKIGARNTQSACFLTYYGYLITALFSWLYILWPFVYLLNLFTCVTCLDVIDVIDYVSDVTAVACALTKYRWIVSTMLCNFWGFLCLSFTICSWCTMGHTSFADNNVWIWMIIANLQWISQRLAVERRLLTFRCISQLYVSMGFNNCPCPRCGTPSSCTRASCERRALCVWRHRSTCTAEEKLQVRLIGLL